jgi:phosphatidylglycerol:prolipoprotein diacylglycerol transferase
LAVLLGRRRGLPPLLVVDTALAAAGGGLLVGRVIYVAAHWTYFSERAGEVIAFWRGGLSAPGMLLGGLLSVWSFCRLKRCDGKTVLDCLTPGAALAVALAWLGCLQAGCACGIETWPDQGLLWKLSAELPDLYGLRVPRVAVQVLGAAWGAVVMAITLGVGRRGRPFPLGLLLYAAGDFALAFLRADVSRWEMIILQGIDLALVGVALFVACRRRRGGR